MGEIYSGYTVAAPILVQSAMICGELATLGSVRLTNS